MSKSSLLAMQPEAASGNGQSAPFPTTASILAAAGKASVKSAPSAKSGVTKAVPLATRAKAAPVKADSKAGSKPDVAVTAPGAAKGRPKPAVRNQAAPAPTVSAEAAATAAAATEGAATAVDAKPEVPKAVKAVKPVGKVAAKKEVPRTAAKPVSEVAAKPAVAKAAAKPAASRAAAKPRRAALEPAQAAAREKAHKPKLVRDSFTMPEGEYAVLNQVKKACLKAGFDIKKSELLRIGVAAVSQLDMATLQQVLSELPQLKTGRPKKT